MAKSASSGKPSPKLEPQQPPADISIATDQDEKDAAVSISITTGIGQRYQLSIKPKNGRPILLAVHL
jgi:hypothetical protein